MKGIQEQIESAVSEFEKNLSKIGISNSSSAILLQIYFDGDCYTKYSGNLSNFLGQSIFLQSNVNVTQQDFYSFFANEIESMPVAESTKRNHRDTLKLLRRFKPQLEFSQLNFEFLASLDAYLVLENYAVNTIARHMKVLKQYINRAIVLEYIQTTPFRRYKIRSAETERETLSEKELILLESYRQEVKERNEILEAFLFSCYSGLRYSDMCRLTKQHVVTLNRKRWIVLRMKKTDTDIRVPIYLIFNGKGLQLLKDIRRSRGVVFRLPDCQKVNRELKKICKQVGIKKHITFHCARHTCATLLLYKGVNITTVQKILGHKSVKTTQIYSAVTDLTIEWDIKKSNKKGNRG